MTDDGRREEGVSLARYTSWKIGGPARFFAEVRAPAQLRDMLVWARERTLPVFVLGGGSNTLVLDSGFTGLVLRYRAQELRIDTDGDTARVRVAAGATMAGTARKLARLGWSGLQWAEGVPGTIGGAVYGNAGCYGGDIASSLSRAWLLVNGETEEWPVARFAYGYRCSVLKAQPADFGFRILGFGLQPTTEQGPTTDDRPPTDRRPMMDDAPAQCIAPLGTDAMHRVSADDGRRTTDDRPIILAAEFHLVRDDPVALAEQIERTAALRRSKTPSGQSCGSVFKNPPGDSAGRLLDAAGLKGKCIGGAVVAEKHANYIINRGDATSDDVLRLIDLARSEVLRRFGVELALEVEILGDR